MCRKLAAIILLLPFLPLPLLSQEASQGISSEENNQQEDPLEKSLMLLYDTISLIGNIQSDNERLKAELTSASDMLRLQGRLLNEQAKIRAEQSQISERQSALLSRELKKGKILKWSLIISAPLCMGLGVWLGWKMSR